MEIRQPRRTELEPLRDIESQAGTMFADIGMHAIATDAPPSVETLARFAAAGLAWVAVSGGKLAAYLIAEPVDTNLHIEQVSVRPEFARRGIGSSLLAHASQVARAKPWNALTLTTFSQVPWNAPYYRRLGFMTLPAGKLPPGLAAIRQHEIDIGLDRWPREAMIRPL